MKKILLCIFLLLSGCNSQYISNRNSQSDSIIISMIIDEKESSLIDGLSLNVNNIYVCNEDCIEKFYEAENEYVDGIIIIGDNSCNARNEFKNINQIPIIQINKQDQFEALKLLYPEYTWHKVTEEELPEVDAYFYEKDIEVTTEKIFYQENNEQSCCQLTIDRKQLEKDINEKINQLIDEQIIEDIIIKYIKK